MRTFGHVHQARDELLLAFDAPRVSYHQMRTVTIAVVVMVHHKSAREVFTFLRALAVWVGGVNHCRLAKSRGLMRRGKDGAVIGPKMHFFVCAQYELPGYLVWVPL
jgi:hypothetical protein